MRNSLRGLPPLGVDCAIAAAVYGATASLLAAAKLPWWTYVLVSVTAVPLIWRRRWPSTIAVITGIGTMALHVPGYLHDQPYGQSRRVR